VVVEPESAGGAQPGMLVGSEAVSEPVRVLLVEDDPRPATMLAQMLRAVWPRGLVLIHTAGLKDAAQELLDHGASCVLLDSPPGMPVADAVSFLATASPDAPVIVIAAATDPEAGLAAIRAGAQDFFAAQELTAAALRRAIIYAVERKRSEVTLSSQALHDPLTGLPNRALFIDRLRGALDRTRRTGTPVVVLFLDVDDFKVINDTLGHAAGDRLMTMLADRFRGLMRPMDTVARFGGDEFTFLFEGLEAEPDARVLAERIAQSAAQPLSLDGAPISVTVSIGTTIVSDPQDPIEEIIRRADTAMYQAKRFGGGRYEVFEDRASETEAMTLEDDLSHAVERSQLRVHYQPRVSLDGETGLVGFEALVRWEHPERGLMEPADFIDVAEESGLILPIGDWVLGEALHQVTEWRESRPGVTISVNLSSRQLVDPGLAVRVAETMRRGGHDPAVLCLEVPEGALEHEPAVACRQLAALNEMGITLAIDDFGTGSSSASNLQQMPVHILKIDRTLVSGLSEQSGDAGVSAAVALGHALGLSVVAEGVETDGQLVRLRELGCDGAQGYLFSEPMPEECVDSILGVG
jgi:diguanylate cyclase (GGDEF)-like protein